MILLVGLLAITGQWNDGLSRWWCVPAGLLLLGLAYEAALVSRCRVQLRLATAERWLLGRPQRVRLAFRQDTRAALSIQAALSAPAEIAAEPRVETLRISQGQETVASLGAAARRLGRFAWPAPAVRIAGPLGLAWWPSQVTADCTVTVVPDAIVRVAKALGTQSAGAEHARGSGGGTEILQLREYRHGDPLRIIDWKATARRRRPISRDMIEDQHLEIIVGVDAGRASGLAAGDIDRLGMYVNVAARLVQRAAELDDAVGVMVFAASPHALLLPARGTAAVVRIRSLLAGCRVLESESNCVLAAARIRTMTHRRSLVVLLTDVEDAAAGEQLAQAVRLLSPKHYTFVAGLESPRIAALPQASAREPIAAYRALAAIDYCNALASNVRVLRALGAAALIARPELLDQAVFEAYLDFRRRRRV